MSRLGRAGASPAWRPARARSPIGRSAPAVPSLARSALVWSVLACAVPACAVAPPLAGQGIRGELRAGGTFLELRPLLRDSLPENDVEGDGLRRRLADGTIASCVPDEFCRWYRSGSPEMLSLLTQDLRVTAWGGLQGLSARAHLRARFGSDGYWPATEQRFEAVTAYLDFDRPAYRARVGRIARSDALGYYNFDGASVLWRGLPPVWLEAYGGWSLARGLNAPRSGDLVEEAEDLPPDDRGLLLGAQAGGRLGSVSATLAYQRDIRTDRLAIYAERVALDLRGFRGRWTFDASAEYDWASRTWNEARLRVTGLVGAAVEASAEARHYEPFFESWTIWGAFTPVGFNEARASLAWRPAGDALRLEVAGAYRDYEDTFAEGVFAPRRQDGWRAAGAASWSRAGWQVSGSYRADVGPGAARFGGDVAGGYTFGPGRWISARASRTQTFGELRLNEQFVSGLGLEAGWRVGDVSLTGGAALYRLDGKERPAEADWTQSRFHAGAAFRFGSEPGGRP